MKGAGKVVENTLNKVINYQLAKYFLDTGGMSSRNMGKNDLWIAAAASVLNAKLLTTDKDFDHLNEEFLEIIYIDPKAKYEIKG